MNKKFYISLLILSLIGISVTNALSITEQQKGAILDNFARKQYDLLFRSELLNFTNEYSNIFNISKQVDNYSSMYSDVVDERQGVEEKRDEVIRTISSLEASIATLDNDISKVMQKLKDMNTKIINIKNDIEVNIKTIDNLKEKVTENTEILLEYLIYIYKKSNTAYSGEEIDNIKSILLNGESIGDLINDLYFKGLIQVTGKNLIDTHRKFISELYLKKVALEKQEEELKNLRKQEIIEQKILKDKKDFKEKLLESSKGEQANYEQYLKEKLDVENEIRLKTIKEQIKLNTTRNQILSKYNCTYIDVSKNTAEVRTLRIQNPKCYSINKIIISENELLKNDLAITDSNPFEWPVNPVQGITAFFREKEYRDTFGSEHNAIDIKVPQGTDVLAPMDGYVMYIQKPTSPDYAYLAIKHYNGYITVYGHISEVLVGEFEFVEKGKIIAKSGGEYGTYGAGYVTTGPHLHFEIFKNQENIDPLSVLDLSYLQYQSLPEKYQIKFAIDFRNKNGYTYEDMNTNSKLFVLEGKTEIDRQKYLISKYAAPLFRNWQMWIDESLDGNIDPSFVICIGLAESTLGNNLSTAFNVGNVGNNDRGDRVAYKNAEEGIYAIVQTLNNRFLGNYSYLAQLSGGGRKEVGLSGCGESPTEYCYASSMDNWHNNMKRCLSHLKGVYVDDYYKFRFN